MPGVDLYTKLMMHCNRKGENHTPTITYVGNATVTNSVYFLDGYSLYLDGSGDYVTLPYSTDWDLQSNFTIELFIAIDNILVGQPIIGQATDVNNYWLFYWDSDDKLKFTTRSSGTLTTKESDVVSLQQGIGSYVVLTKSAGALLFFLDGIFYGTSAISHTIPTCTGALHIGKDPSGNLFPSNDYQGFIEEVQIYNGTARYNAGSFPYPLTGIFPNTSTTLLIHFNRDDIEKPQPLTFHGNAQIDTAQYNFNGASLYLDGSSSYVSVTNSSINLLFGRTISIDTWIRLANTSQVHPIIGHSIDSNNHWCFYWDTLSGGSLHFAVVSSGTLNRIDGVFAATAGTWHHVAFSMNQSFQHLLYDGVWLNSTTLLSQLYLPFGTSTLQIGRDPSGVYAPSTFNGHIDEFRLSVGSLKYSNTNYSVRSKQYVADTHSTLLLHFDGSDGATIAPDSAGGDESGEYSGNVDKIVTYNGTAQIREGQNKFGGSSLYLDGSGANASCADSTDWRLLGGDFTIDFWSRFSAITGSTSLVFYGTTSPNFYEFGVGTSSLFFTCATSTASVSWSPSTSTWYHLALVRSSGNLMFFVNGTQQGATQTLSTVNISNGTLKIGNGNATYSMNGYMDEIRISKDIVRWATNFTPSTVEYDANQRMNSQIIFV